MTNEEKARELANLCDDCLSKCCDRIACDNRGKYHGALKMAKWKDEQVKQFLKDRYNKNLGSIKSWETEYIYKELFNEPISEHPMNF